MFHQINFIFLKLNLYRKYFKSTSNCSGTNLVEFYRLCFAFDFGWKKLTVHYFLVGSASCARMMLSPWFKPTLYWLLIVSNAWSYSSHLYSECSGESLMGFSKLLSSAGQMWTCFSSSSFVVYFENNGKTHLWFADLCLGLKLLVTLNVELPQSTPCTECIHRSQWSLQKTFLPWFL